MTELIDKNWLSMLESFDHLYVALSGGLDSTVLLHTLVNQPAITQKITALHVNHSLSNNAESWQAHCQSFCKQFNIPLITKEASFDRSANIEENARKARYTIFRSIIKSNDCLLVGHHRNDQAETLLLQLFRGTGVDGLAAMQPIKKFGRGKLIRPLLDHSRQDLEAYAVEKKLNWLNDESNDDRKFSRNFLRHEVVPVIETRWPQVLKNIAQTASHCQEASSLLEELARLDCADLTNANKSLPIASIKGLNPARIKNVLRVWLKVQEVPLPDAHTLQRIVNELVFSRQDGMAEIQWGNYFLRQYQQSLYLVTKTAEPEPLDWHAFPAALTLPANLGTLTIQEAQEGFCVPPHSKIQVRFRQGGETVFLRGQNKSLKNLFQEWKIPPWLRNRIPLIYFDQCLAIIVGYAISDKFYQSKKDSYSICWSGTST